jgi:RNA polymerase sigma factor (sigma-70 family)
MMRIIIICLFISMLTPAQSVEFDQLYLDHHAWLQGWFCKKLGGQFHADDFTQDAFVRLLLKRVEQQPFTTPRFYLLHIARGLLIDHWRRQALEKNYLETLQQLAPEVAPSVELQAMLLETLLQIDAMLEKLPIKVRSAFLSAQIDGLSYRQIAAELSVSERMVKKYMATAMLHCLQFKQA